ncbi:MAG TPA: hypothetical protein VLT92_02095 [Burkholderiales bacterium]|nr:hypothetical protein [Burkholderiales bacterium]
MDKNDFKPDTRYTVTWRAPDGKVQPANIYVYRVFENFLVARLTGADGLLRKITYPEILKIVSAKTVEPGRRYAIPGPLLDEQTWRDRVVMAHYSSSPRLGK